MPSGLVALLDDIAGITKLAAASLDDIGAAAGRAGAKAAGVVVDDTAVTPRYVMGLSPQRELPIIWRIAKGSLRNKLLILLPVALLLSAFAPWAITPLLMVGGAFLCFEGAEKVLEAVSGHGHGADEAAGATDPKELEDQKVAGAVRTDMILSAEIMAIALNEVSRNSLAMQAASLIFVALAITVGVYGVVALIVKMDDVGLHLAERGSAAVRSLGRGLVTGMPVLMRFLSIVGTAAMLWVGGGIVIHGAEALGAHGLHGIAHFAEDVGHLVPGLESATSWIVNAAVAGVFGLVLGALIAWVVGKVRPHKAH